MCLWIHELPKTNEIINTDGNQQEMFNVNYVLTKTRLELATIHVKLVLKRCTIKALSWELLRNMLY